MEEKQSIDLVHHALDIGVNFIDTSNIYGTSLSEQYIGKGIKGIRDEVFIATKVSASNLRYDQVMRAAEASVRRLDTDYIYLYQIFTGRTPRSPSRRP